MGRCRRWRVRETRWAQARQAAGPMRASHADREQVTEALKDAFAHGRLTKDELDARAGRALAARTCAELAALTAGIPPARAASVRPAAGPGPAPAAGQGGRRVGRLPGPRGRRRVGQLHPRSGRPRRRSLLGWPDGPAGPIRRNRGSVDLVVRGGHLSAAATLWHAGAAPAGAGRPRPRRRTARWHRPWLGSPRPPGRPDLRRSAGSQLTAWSAMSFWAGKPGCPEGYERYRMPCNRPPSPFSLARSNVCGFGNLAPACGRRRRLRCPARRRAPTPHPPSPSFRDSG